MSTDQPPQQGPDSPPSGPGWGGPPPSQPPPSWQGGPPQQYGRQPGSQLSPQEERNWGALAHLSAIIGAWIALGFLGPLVVLLVQGNKSPFVRQHAVEALNFNITVLIAAVVSFILIFVLVGFVLLAIVGIAWLVCTILGAMAASRGEAYRYPLTLRLVS